MNMIVEWMEKSSGEDKKLVMILKVFKSIFNFGLTQV